MRLLLIFLFFSCIAEASDELNALDDKISEAIKSACHGYRLDIEIGDIINTQRDSPICSKVIAAGDAPETIKQAYKHTLTQQELDSIYARMGTTASQDDQLSAICSADFMCMKMMGKHKGLTKEFYSAIAQHCQSSLSQYNCIENWFEQQWEKGVRSAPSSETTQIGGLSLDDLMAGSGYQTDSKAAPSGQPSISMDYKDPHTLEKETKLQGEIGFDNIYEGRHLVKVDNKQKRLKQMSTQISERCNCTSNSCFKQETFDFDQITSAAADGHDQFESHMETVCDQWADNIQGITSDNLDNLEVLVSNSDIILTNLDKLDKGYQDFLDELQEAENQTHRQIEEQQAAKRRSAIGKAFALGATAVIAGSADLSASQFTEVMTRATSDILTGSNSLHELNMDLQMQSLNSPQQPDLSNDALGFSSKTAEAFQNQQLQRQKAKPQHIGSPPSNNNTASRYDDLKEESSICQNKQIYNDCLNARSSYNYKGHSMSPSHFCGSVLDQGRCGYDSGYSNIQGLLNKLDSGGSVL